MSIRFCCPQYTEGSCDVDGFEWTSWLDRDDPTSDGDYEHRSDYAHMDICETPIGIDARARTSGSTEVTHIDLQYGFWCNNDEQTNGDCADFEVRYCCPKKQEKKCEEPGTYKYYKDNFIIIV